MGNVIDVGQVLLDLESLNQGSASGPAVLLDTRPISSHLRLPKYASSQRAKYEKSKRRAIHSSLKEVLNSMATGEHGVPAMMLALKVVEDVSRCGGRTRRHDVCGRPSWLPHSCKFQLCPWFQQAKAKKAGARLHQLWTDGAIADPHFGTFTVHNVDDLDGAWIEIRHALGSLHRRAYIKAHCRGGFRALETTVNKADGRWNAHAHELLDCDFIAQYPMTDIAWRWDRDSENGRILKTGHWVVKQEHPGLARLWTMECQGMRRQADGKRVPRYPLLYRKGINLDCPEDWFLVNIKAADYGAISEIAKYVAKGDEIVQAGPVKIMEYLQAIQGKRMLQGFGSLYNVSLKEEEEDVFEAPTAPGECPYPDCPDPREPVWEFVCSGPPDDWVATRDNRTGRYRLHPEGIDPPSFVA